MHALTFQAAPRCRIVASVRWTVACGLLLALALLPAPSGAVEPSTDHDVVVVGAGASGLYAAYTLHKCFMMGINAEVMEALPNDTARIDRALVDLDAAFSGAASTAYVEGIVQNWTAEPYVLGSYSFPAPGTRPVAGSTMREVLAQPVGTTLYFAGEATHNTAASTVPGALQSGERAGGEVDTNLGGPPAPGTPTADFSASLTMGGAPLDVSFTDMSNQIPTAWSWDFGDGGSSSLEHPSHQYTTPGVYSVSLTATNPDGSHTRVLPNLIAVPEPSGIVGLRAGVVGLLLLDARRRRNQMRSRRGLDE